MPIRLAVALAASIVIAGCAASSSKPSVEDAPMNAESKESLSKYFARTERPKVFAFSPTSGAAWYAWGYPSVEETQAIALGKCEEFGSPCEVYAINDVVVWKKK